MKTRIQSGSKQRRSTFHKSFSDFFWLQQFYMEADLIQRSNKKIRHRYRKNPGLFLNQLRQQRFNLRYSITDKKKDYEGLADPHTSYYFSTPSVKDHLKYYRKALKKQESNQSSRKVLNKLLTVRINEKFSDHITPNTLVYAQQLTNLELETLNKKSSSSLNKKSKKSIGELSDQNLTHHGFSKKKHHYFKQIKPLDSTLSHQLSPSHGTEYPKSEQGNQIQEKNEVKHKKKGSVAKVKGHLKTNRSKQASEASPECQNSIQSSSRMKTTSKDKVNQLQKTNKLAEELHRLKHEKWLNFLNEKKQLLSKNKEVNPEETNTNK